jgi:hypothetical protein
VTLGLLVVATVLGGILAGATADRLFVGYAAWRAVGVRAWAAYSRHADLGNGRFFYPPLAILGTIAAIGAWIAAQGDAAIPRSVVIVLAAAALLELVGLLLTRLAGPNMLRARGLSDDDTPALEHSFREFYRWSTYRGIAHLAGFVVEIIALGAVSVR